MVVGFLLFKRSFKMIATIESWVHDKKQNVIVGEIYGDVLNRWPDGTLFMTSKLRTSSMQLHSVEEDAEVRTQNNWYKLGKKKG
jgi:hypothetical protein